LKRKYREAMRAANRARDMWADDPADALQGYEENAQRRTLWPPMPVKPAGGEPWRPVMTEQERQQHEQYVRENQLPF
jgi:hypothetical protein